MRRDFIFMGQEPRLPAGVPGCVPGAVGREPQGSGMARETDPPLEKAAFELSVPRAAESSVVGIVRLTDRVVPLWFDVDDSSIARAAVA